MTIHAGREWKTAASSLFALILLIHFGAGESLAQGSPKEEAVPEIRLGNVTSKAREIEAKPSNLRMLEIYIEVFNRSPGAAAPANSVKVLLTLKEVKFSSPNPAVSFAPPPEEAIVSLPLPPGSGRVMMMGLEIPQEKLESITFEVQVNPPEGERKTVSFNP